MKVLVTGASGFIGNATAEALVAAGHEVIAPVRSDASGDAASAVGATPVIGDLTDRDWLTAQLADVDASVHLASPGDASSPDFDTAVVDAVLSAFGGTAKRHVHTSGVWIYGNGSTIDEHSPLDPPELTAWRIPVEQRLLDSEVSVGIVAPGIVYGHGGGIAVATTQQTDADGRVLTVGDGSQHWTSVHVDDLADLYRIVLEHDEVRGRVLGVSGVSPAASEIASAAAGSAGTARSTVDETRERLGTPFADALLLDQQASGAYAKSLGWTPTRPSMLDDLAG